MEVYLHTKRAKAGSTKLKEQKALLLYEYLGTYKTYKLAFIQAWKYQVITYINQHERKKRFANK